ncbi:sugar phosphate isomerase/epimerase family protein [Paenarthrobacter sp. YIM B13468]|uniref:sugar phosphate isomerase/epimerase family protein n=1 Tax=Paenarthrobacter sp. YIM B13468 TaxID=3366295 RepID=UPI003672073B
MYAYQVNAWGDVVGTPGAVTDLASGHYFTPGDLDPALEAIAAAGFSGVEIFDGNLLALGDDAQSFGRRLETHGLVLAGVYSGGHFIYPDAHEEEYLRFERSIKVAASLGARHFVIGGGGVRVGGRLDSDFQVMAELLERVAELAEAEGLIPSYHPHLGSLAENPDQIDALFTASSIGLCADVAHLAAGGGDPIRIIERYADRLSYVHLKNYLAASGTFVPLAEGDLDIHAILSAITTLGYSDWIGVELDGYPGDPGAAAADNFKFLQEATNA